MRGSIEITTVTTRRGTGISRRNHTLRFYLFSTSKTRICVCKTFYMSTLGMKTNGYISEFVKSQNKNPIATFREKRGGCRAFDCDEEQQKIIDHINSYNPQISHYNSEHSPNRRYLDSELSIRDLWKDYISQSVNRTISYSLYQKVFRTLNIGFARPSQDECEVCDFYNNHSHDITEEESSCQKCAAAKIHLENASLARHSYQQDRSEENSPAAGHMTMAADMQKVIMLPKMNLKSQYFVSRLTKYCDFKFLTKLFVI